MSYLEAIVVWIGLRLPPNSESSIFNGPHREVWLQNTDENDEDMRMIKSES